MHCLASTTECRGTQSRSGKKGQARVVLAGLPTLSYNCKSGISIGELGTGRVGSSAVLCGGSPAVALGIDLEDGRVMDEAVDGGDGHGRIGEDLVPLAEGLIAGDDEAGIGPRGPTLNPDYQSYLRLNARFSFSYARSVCSGVRRDCAYLLRRRSSGQRRSSAVRPRPPCALLSYASFGRLGNVTVT